MQDSEMFFTRPASRVPPAISRAGCRLAIFLLAACIVSAASELTGPSLGLIYDADAQSIRPILGIAGASTAGRRIDLGFRVTAAAISPSHEYALVSSGDGSLRLVTFDALSARILETTATPDRVVLSPSGSSALFYYNDALAIQILTGLPGAVKVSPAIDISTLRQAPGALAISDDGTVALAAVGEAVYVVPVDATAPRSIARVQHASAITFYPQSHDVLIADDAANSITMLAGVAGRATVQWNFSDAGLLAPDSIQPAMDRKTILAGSSKNGTLAIFDPTRTVAPVFVTCQCAPTEVRPMKAPSIYQVTEPKDGLSWILDANPANPRVLFVPIPTDSEITGPGSHRR